jgi:hypothetical protein
MPFLSHYHAFSFFKNKELNLFYLAIAIKTFAESLIGIFVPIYLYNLGYSIPMILLFYLLDAFFYVLFSYSCAKVVALIGAKHSILLSAPFLVLYYVGLIFIPKYEVLFFILPAILSVRRTFYFFGYHLNYIRHSDKKNRGKEISFLSALAMFSAILAPFIGGSIAYFGGFSLLYIIGSILIICGAIPLFITKDTYDPINFSAKELWKTFISKNDRGILISYLGYSVETVVGRIIWPIFLILIVYSIEKTGLIVTASMFLSLGIFYVIGHLTDTKNKIWLVRLGAVLYFFGWLGRIFADTAIKIFFIDSYKNITEKILIIPWDARNYDLAEERGRFRFLVARDLYFNIIRVFFFPIFILVFYLGFYPFLISFIIAAVFSLGFIFWDK